MEALGGMAVLATLVLGVILLVMGVLMPIFVYRTMVYTGRTWLAVERLAKEMRERH